MMLVNLEIILMIILAMAAVLSSYLNLRLHQKKYAQHVIFNQPTESQKRLLKYPYIYFLGILLLMLFYSWLLANYLSDDLQQFFFGIFISLFAIIFGSAIGGILIFLYALKNPEKVSGQAIFKDQKILALHLQNPLIPSLFLLISLIIIQPTPFIWGSLIAVISLLLRLVKYKI